MSTEDKFGFGFVIFMFLFSLSCLAAWVNHIVWIISKLASDAGATTGQMVLGALGAFMPPVGVVHGFMLFFDAGM
jgi:hypothetical protein